MLGDLQPSPEYIEARRVLLDALDALGPQAAAVVLAGAQAIYVRTGPNSLPIADYTTDGDLTIDPALLQDAPPLDELMEAAGFELATQGGGVEPGIWRKEVRADGREISVPIDLIVPTGIASGKGRRGARLGTHGNYAARKVPGLEPALIDNDRMRISALDSEDSREFQLRVAGPAALLIAKMHKLADRIVAAKPTRLDDKDAADVLRLMQTTHPASIASTMKRLFGDPVAGSVVAKGLEHLDSLFGGRAGLGIQMASRAVRTAIPEERVRTICLAYSDELQQALAST